MRFQQTDTDKIYKNNNAICRNAGRGNTLLKSGINMVGRILWNTFEVGFSYRRCIVVNNTNDKKNRYKVLNIYDKMKSFNEPVTYFQISEISALHVIAPIQ